MRKNPAHVGCTGVPPKDGIPYRVFKRVHDRVTAQLPSMTELLTLVEWAGPPYGPMRSCPACRGLHPEDAKGWRGVRFAKGHLTWCWLKHELDAHSVAAKIAANVRRLKKKHARKTQGVDSGPEEWVP